MEILHEYSSHGYQLDSPLTDSRRREPPGFEEETLYWYRPIDLGERTHSTRIARGSWCSEVFTRWYWYLYHNEADNLLVDIYNSDSPGNLQSLKRNSYPRHLNTIDIGRSYTNKSNQKWYNARNVSAHIVPLSTDSMPPWSQYVLPGIHYSNEVCLAQTNYLKVLYVSVCV